MHDGCMCADNLLTMQCHVFSLYIQRDASAQRCWQQPCICRGCMAPLPADSAPLVEPPPFYSRGTSQLPTAALFVARARMRWCLACLVILHRRGGDAPFQQVAAEVLNAILGALWHTRSVRARTPELLSNGGHAGPHSLLQIGAVDGLAPHLAMASEDLAAEVVRHVVARLIGIDGAPRHVEVVEIPRGCIVAHVAKDIVAGSDDFGYVGDIFPHMNDRILRQIRLKVVVDLAPLHWPLALGSGDGCCLLHKVCVRAVSVHALLLHPRSDRRCLGPAIGVDLVAAQVHELVWEEMGSLRQQIVEHLERVVTRDVQWGEAARRRADVGLARAPALAVPGHVELHHHAHAPQPRVLHHLGHVGLRVPLRRGERCIPQAWMALDLEGKRLIIDHMPVQHVELGKGQGVDDRAQRGERLVVTCSVHHQSAVLEARCIMYVQGYAVDDVSVRVEVKAHELGECLERT
mmetsp:Transcript_23422/g.59760  ORF Transcript_23422/g.59760 Transcript_23422/m.59760 type:complete len:462 (+) Transcript_23422:236-1621(+)